MSLELTDLQERNLALANRMLEVYEAAGPWALHERFDEFHHPDFAWTPAVSEMGGKTYRGRDGYGQWVADMDAVAAEISQRDFEIRCVGESHVLALCELHLVGRESHLTLDSDYGMLFHVEEGRARSGRAFLSHGEAERAAAEIEAASA